MTFTKRGVLTRHVLQSRGLGKRLTLLGGNRKDVRVMAAMKHSIDATRDIVQTEVASVLVSEVDVP